VSLTTRSRPKWLASAVVGALSPLTAITGESNTVFSAGHKAVNLPAQRVLARLGVEKRIRRSLLVRWLARTLYAHLQYPRQGSRLSCAGARSRFDRRRLIAMSGIIFGVFENRAQADAAVEELTRQTEGSVNAVVHQDHFRDEDVQMSGTDALKGAVKGALLVGIAGAIIGSLMMIPAADLSIGWTEWVFLGFAGTIFGVTAGAVAGASESREEIRAMASKLEAGNVLVTMEADDTPAATIVDLLAAKGALEVKAA
jgi:hypothetical protein